MDNKIESNFKKKDEEEKDRKNRMEIERKRTNCKKRIDRKRGRVTVKRVKLISNIKRRDYKRMNKKKKIRILRMGQRRR